MSKSLKILLLEDNESDAILIQRLLKKDNPYYEFYAVMDEPGYVKALKEFQPDIIVSDNALPQFDATEALLILRERFPHVPFILVTGTVSEEFAVSIIKLGADDYLLKDRLVRLPESIKAALKQRETERKNMEAEEKNKFKADLLNTIGQAVLATDNNGIINFWNKAAEKIYGWTSEEAIGKNVYALIRPQKTEQYMVCLDYIRIASCHEVKPHKAREMCVVCYGKWRWQNHKRIIDSYINSNPKLAAEIGLSLRTG